MTNRYLGRDVRDQIVTLLTNSFVTTLATIDSERTSTTPAPIYIGYGWTDNQFPALFVDLGNSSIQQENSDLTNDYTQTVELYTVEVTCVITDAIDLLYNYIENYIEGIIRVLHNYHDTNITWVSAVETKREDLYLRENQTMKIGTVAFEVRVN